MKRGRRAPRDGYNFRNKRVYRDDLYKAMRSAFVGQPKGLVICMPSTEGAEIRTAWAQGFRGCDIRACDWNPAIVATATRKFKLGPGFGCNIGEAFTRLASDGHHVSAVNLDLTSCLSAKTIRDLTLIARSSAFASTGPTVVGITLLRGRESGLWSNLVRTANIQDGGADDLRLSLAFSALGKPFRIIARSTYVSASGQSMLWAVAVAYPATAWLLDELHRCISSWQRMPISQRRRLAWKFSKEITRLSGISDAVAKASSEALRSVIRICVASRALDQESQHSRDLMSFVASRILGHFALSAVAAVESALAFAKGAVDAGFPKTAIAPLLPAIERMIAGMNEIAPAIGALARDTHGSALGLWNEKDWQHLTGREVGR